MILQIIFLILFLGVSCFHLIDCWNDNDRRFRTKPLLMLLLLVFYLFSAKLYSLLLIIALILSFLGDVLLIRDGEKWLIAGGASFLAAHILYIFLYARRIDPSAFIPSLVIPIAVVYCAATLFFIWQLLGSAPKGIPAALYIYLMVNAAMNLFALMHLIAYRTPGAVLAYIGAICFFLSDCILFLVLYAPEKVRFHPHFLVMSTYIAGQFLITLGMVLS